MRIFIPFNTPSSKNSKIKTQHGIFHSKATQKYLQKLGIKSYSTSKKKVTGYKTRFNLFEIAVVSLREFLKDKEPPYLIGFYFVRDSKRKFDLINASHIVFDLLVAHRVINDDDMNNLIPIPIQVNNTWYAVDKNNSGVYLYILTAKNIQGLKYVE